MSHFTSFMAIGCTHRPIHDEAYCQWIIKQVDEIKPKVFVHCGDLFDNDCVGKFAKGSSPSLKQEYDNANDFLDELNHKLPEDCQKVLTQGNHCSRIFRQENKHLAELLDFRIHCPALENWTIFDYKQHPRHVFKLGQVTFAHGWGTTKRSAVVEAVNLSGPNTLYVHAHTHRGINPYQVLWGEKLALPYWIANTGCGIASDVEYFQTHDVSNWNRGFIVGVVDTKTKDRSKPNWEAEFVEHSRIWD